MFCQQHREPLFGQEVQILHNLQGLIGELEGHRCRLVNYDFIHLVKDCKYDLCSMEVPLAIVEDINIKLNAFQDFVVLSLLYNYFYGFHNFGDTVQEVGLLGNQVSRGSLPLGLVNFNFDHWNIQAFGSKI